MISPLAFVDASAKIGKNVSIAPFAFIDADTQIGDGCVIGAHASILKGSRIGQNNKIHEGAIIGAEPQDFRYEGQESSVIIGDGNDIRENVVIARGMTKDGATRIGNGCYLMEGVHVCHDATISDSCVIGLKTIVAGGVTIESYVILSNAVILQQDVHIGSWSMIQSGCRVGKDIPPYIMVSGNPATYHGINSMILKNNKQKAFSEETISHIMTAYLIIYQGGVSLQDAVMRIKEQVTRSEEIDDILSFIKSSKGMLS